MPTIVYRISDLLCQLLRDVYVGTNLGLYSLLWTLLSGRFLLSCSEWQAQQAWPATAGHPNEPPGCRHAA